MKYYQITRTNGELATQEDALVASTDPVRLSCLVWPCRLFVVEPVGKPVLWQPDMPSLPLWTASEWQAVHEVPSHAVFGPQGWLIPPLLRQARKLTDKQLHRLDMLSRITDNPRWYTLQEQADREIDSWEYVSEVANDQARYAALMRLKAQPIPLAALAAARALVVRDVAARGHYDNQSGIWRRTIGPIHPQDPVRKKKPEKDESHVRTLPPTRPLTLQDLGLEIFDLNRGSK